MMQIKRFVTNPIGENCYLVWDDSRECAIVDCGALDEDKQTKIARYLEENKLRPRMALQTHMHFDHVMGLHFLQRQYGLLPSCHELEMPVYEFSPVMALNWFGMQMESPLVSVGEYLTDGQELALGDTSLCVLHTPGHTPGGLSFYFPKEKLLFTGDTLFQGSVGRSDLPGGDMGALVEGIRTKILSLPGDVRIFPGHGPETTVENERRFNPYI